MPLLTRTNSFAASPSNLFSKGLERVAVRCGAGRPEAANMSSPGNFGVLDVVTAGFTPDRWPRQNLAGKTAHIALHVLGSAAQVVAWVPLGAAAAIIGVAFCVTGHHHLAATVLDHNLLAATFFVGALDLCIQILSMALLMGWLQARLQAR